MQELEVAMVDITLLIATCRAARELRAHAMSAHLRAHWHHLCTEVKRATLAYVNAFSQADNATVAACRAAAEREMPGALASPHELRALLEREPGWIDGSTVVRVDLSRLCHLEIRMSEAGADTGSLTDRRRRRVEKASQYVQQRLRWAILAYARASLRGPGEYAIHRARNAAAGQLDGHCVDAVARLARSPGVGRGPLSLIQRGVARPLRRLRKDWKDVAVNSVAW